MAKKKKSSAPKPSRLDQDAVRLMVKTIATKDDLDEALDILDLLLENSGDDIGDQLARLAVLDLDPLVAQGAAASLALGMDNQYYDFEEIARIADQVGPIVLKALENPKVPDARKVDLVRICELSGWLPEEVNIEKYFTDLGGTMKRMMEKGLENFVGSPEEVASAVLGLKDQGDDEVVPIVLYATVCEMGNHVAKTQPAAAAPVMAAAVVYGVSQELDPGDIAVTLNALDKLAVPESVWWLEAIAKWPSMGSVGDEARRMATRKRMEGIQPACPFIRPFKEALVTAEDALGTYQVLLVYEGVAGGSDVLCVLCRESEGVSGAYVAYEHGEEVVQKSRELSGGIPSALASEELALEYLANALAISLEIDFELPLSLFIHLPYLRGSVPAPERRTPSLDGYDLSVPRTPAMAEAPTKVLRKLADLMMDFFSDEAYAFLGKEGPARGKTLKDDVLTRFLEAIEAVEKPVLLKRMASYLEVAALQGNATQPGSLFALHTLLALRENVIPFASAPLVRELGRRSAKIILENLRAGYLTHAEVEEAFAEGMLDGDD